ncbi:diguanylate cyclase [Rossellomorea aquimaris]|uniref:diguanylate cyclase n=1 Tax=Rossellomorea aquimaris TaxID=189382 RepID=UPI001CD7D5DC|nr:diguanylate cyclase [Rossellomorea aquimaris]MCA1055397.1 diguanylate cyclase [Rossellomorea aquimaris]
MQMEKYQKHFLNNFRKKLEEWEAKQEVEHKEVYRFVHSLAGTASTLGLDRIGDLARKLMDRMDEEEERLWTNAELKATLYEIIEAYYRLEEATVVTEFKGKKGRDGEEPVVLVIDDDTSFLMYMKEELENIGWYVVPIANPEKAVNTFYDVRPDCAIIDIHMDESNGFEVLDFFKHKLKQPFIPMVMVSVDGRKDVRMKSYELGADDFIQKPFELDEFIIRVKRQMQRKKQFEELILIDELTHVYNRKFLTQAYEQVKNGWDRRKEPSSIAVIDIDHFKKVNDRYGHLVGDKVLVGFAKFLKEKARVQDLLVRYGGEEFVIIFQNTNVQDAHSFLDAWREEFSERVFKENTPFSCTFSAGLTEITDPAKPLEEWLSKADQALYEAKEKGRNKVEIDSDSTDIQHNKVIKVAIVDDDPIIRTVMRDIVSKLPTEQNIQYEIKSFKDGALFMESDWHRDSLCLVILDGVMPKMDGLEVLERLRRQKDSDQYKVLMLTSRSSEKDISRSLQLGADDYMTKPFKLLELEARLGQILKRMR